MEFYKLRYYLGGIMFIAIALICILSVIQQFSTDAYNADGSTFDHKIVFFDVAAIMITAPAGILMIRKGRKQS